MHARLQAARRLGAVRGARGARTPARAAVAASQPTTAPPPLLAPPSPAPRARPSLDDVHRIAAGRPAKARGTGSRAVPHRLDAAERDAWETALVRTGFLALHGTGSRRERKGSPAANAWRLLADARGTGCVVLLKRASGQDVVVADASPLRLSPGGGAGAFPPALAAALDAAAAEAGLVLLPPGSPEANDALPWTYLGEAALRDALEDGGGGGGCDGGGGGDQPPHTQTLPIWRLRPIPRVYTGPRPGAKAFAGVAAAMSGVVPAPGGDRKKSAAKGRPPRRVRWEGGEEEDV